MITMLDCVNGISAVLEAVSRQAPVYRDALDDINEPGLYIVPTFAGSIVSGGVRMDSYNITVGWFANGGEDRYLDILTLQEIFANTFTNPIQMGNYYLYPEETEFEVDAQEGTLFCSFKITVDNLLTETAGTYQNMQILEHKEGYI